MGLLEKAMKFKKEINSRGEETIMDKIAGPADTEFIEDNNHHESSSSREDRGQTAGVSNIDVNREDEIIVLNTTDLVEIEDSEIPADETVLRGTHADADTVNILATNEENFDDMSIIENEMSGDELVVTEKFDNESDIYFAEEDQVPSEELLENISNDTNDDLQNEFESVEQNVDLEFEKENDENLKKQQIQRKENWENKFNIPNSDDRFQDFMVLYETGKEIIHSSSETDLFDTIQFLVMGQIGVSSVSILIPHEDVENRWIVAESRGVTIDSSDIYFDSNNGILKNIFTSKAITDIESFRKKKDYHDDFVNFISIDARVLVPMLYHDSIVGIIVLGNKLSSEELIEEEKDFLISVSEFAALTYSSLVIQKHSKREIDKLNKNIHDYDEIDILQDEVFSKDDFNDAKQLLQDEFIRSGIAGYSMFILNEFNTKFVPILVDGEDLLSIEESKLSIHMNNSLITYISKAKSPIIIDNFQTFDVVTELFDQNQRSKMTVLRIYPFKLGAHLIGFSMVFKADSDRIDEIDKRMLRITDLIFPYIISQQNIYYTKKKYIDTVEHIFNRINEEIVNAENLQIPLTIVQFSIKNFRRYYSAFGREKAFKLINGIETIIQQKIADVDFSIRYDRHKILLILPGKNKEYAIPLANAIKNEIIHLFSKKEMQLLITFLAAEYPVDGNDLFTLIDAVE